MFGSDFWREVWLTVKSQKWRSLMTAFGVCWGIFMLLLLLGFSVGLNNGFIGRINKQEGNAVFMRPQLTTLPYNGFPRDREWQLNNDDLLAVYEHFKDQMIEMGGYNLDGGQNVSTTDNGGTFTVVGTSPAYYRAMPLQMIYGRFINQLDMVQNRKECVIGKAVYEKFYPNGGDPCGDEINVGGLVCKIAGVVKKTNNIFKIHVSEDETVFLPLTVEQVAFNKVNMIDVGLAILRRDVDASYYQDRIVAFVKGRHNVSPEDDNAVIYANLGDITSQFESLLDSFNLLVWIVGIGTLIAGLIGISNIMLITVKERTQEIGVRRALGAKPWNIVVQIMAETFVLTFCAGFTGMLIATFLVSMARMKIETVVNDDSMIGIPQIPFEAAMAAFVIIIAGSLIAGFVPVKRALSIKAIDALRSE